MFLLSQTTHRMVIRYDSQLGHRYVPNLVARLPSERGGFYVRTNSWGFRSDREFVAENNAGRPRVLFFGDSYTAGDGCENAERYPERVGELFDAEVYNFGLSGSGTDQQLLILEQVARDVDADLIVLGVMIENIERIKVSHREGLDRTTGTPVLIPKPYFTLAGGGQLTLHQVPVPRERAPVAGGKGPAVQHRFERQHPLLHRALGLYRHRRLASIRHLADGSLAGVRTLALRAGRVQLYPDYASASSDGWRLMAAILQRFCDAAAPRPVLIVPIPPFPYYYYELEPIYQARFQALARPGRGVHVADITTPLLERPRAQRKTFRFQRDTHFSPQGHRAIAEIVGHEIARRGLLPAATPPPPRPVSRPAPPSPTRPCHILGISAFYHDSAAALVSDGQIVAAAAEERFSRVKNDRRFPHRACNYCLEEAGIHQSDLAAVVYYDNASLTFERLMHTLAAVGERGRDAWSRAMPSWVGYKLQLPALIRQALCYGGTLLWERHHRSHAASAYFPSPFDSAAILTVDGVGEWATASIARGRGATVEMLGEMHFPHSLGLLYSAFTAFTGFKVNSGEYKMMGLAPYGRPRYVDTILQHIVDLKDDGSIELNLDYFSFLSQPTMTNERFADLFGGPARKPDEWISPRETDIARSIQEVIERALIKMARHAVELAGETRLCMAGGVALNCVANGKILRRGVVDQLWIQPAAGDAGCAIGAALDAYHSYFGKPREQPQNGRAGDGRAGQGGSLLGPAYSRDEILAFLETHGHTYRELRAPERAGVIADYLASGAAVGHFAGRLEFGPRALGSRSILADPRSPQTQANLNLKIKYRESFRPFAPTVLAENASDYFELEGESPYMLLVAPVQKARRLPFDHRPDEDLRQVVARPRSDLPAITHVDYSARIQTLERRHHPEYYDLIAAFRDRSGHPVVVNTSFNIRGEPIVCTPEDAHACFVKTNMDVLILGDFLVVKTQDQRGPSAPPEIDEHKPAPAARWPAQLIDQLDRIFTRHFRPLAAQLRARGLLRIDPRFGAATSTWRPCQRDQAPPGVFAIPFELQTSAADPEALARAHTRAWSPGPATDALCPILVQLLGLKNQIDRAAVTEDVPESVYVMF